MTSCGVANIVGGQGNPGRLGPVEQPGDAVDDVRPDTGLVIDIGLTSEDLVEAAVGGHVLGRLGEDLGRDDHFFRQMPAAVVAATSAIL
jgi:hypothetical protein